MSLVAFTELRSETTDNLLSTAKKELAKRSYNVVSAMASAARTTSTSTGPITNPGYKGIMVTLTIAAFTAGGLRIRITTGTGFVNTVYYDSVSFSAVASRTVVVYPGISSSSAQLGTTGLLGPLVFVGIEADTADSITYSMSYCLIE
jgi:hypothetical protein